MKKMILAMLLLAFAGVSFAEMPKIVNPPRPTQKYKYLLLVRYKILCYDKTIEYKTDYIYTNSYRIQKYQPNKNFSDVLEIGKPSKYCTRWPDSLSCVKLDYPYGININQQDQSGNPAFVNFYPQTAFVLVSKAPKLEGYPFVDTMYQGREEISNEEFLEKIHMLNPRKPQKAKVVFTK